MRRFIDDSRAVGATPVLITLMVRRSFDAQGKLTEGSSPDGKLASYANAMREVAREKHVSVIDLHASSQALVESLGPQASADMANKKGDNTHFNEKGARAMAELMMKQLPVAEPKLKPYLK